MRRHAGRDDLSRPDTMNNTQVTQGFLLYFVLPLWICAGAADWICHRVSHIEQTSGSRESMIHLLMFTEIGAALLPGLLLQINSLIIAWMIVMYFVHEATAMWDVRYATAHRRLAPIEQNIHSFLDMIPLMAVSFVIILHWQQFLALLGMGTEAADFSIRAKIGPVPTVAYTGTMLATSFILTTIPYVEELARCIRAERARTTHSSNALKTEAPATPQAG